ncbi:MAG: hypothetical protein P4L69_11930 [Desulfosporosinus sp.]|nr:hypothetical protein [Desulfosporosinus sp.]
MLSGKARSQDYANVIIFDTFESLADPVAYFGRAMTIELEHGRAAAQVGANVTDDDALATARIAKAHLFGVEYGGETPYEPFPTYYDFLIWMEYVHSKAVELRKNVI